MRGFEIVGKYRGKDFHLPKRQTTESAGYDLAAAEDTDLPPNVTVLVPTAVKAYMGKGEVLKIYARSSLAVRRNIVLPNSVGIIDADYYGNDVNEGQIFVALMNCSDETQTIKRGERIAQGIFERYLLADDDDADGERVGGFGSTGTL